MNELSYITTIFSKIVAEQPGSTVTVLEYVCAVTLLIAMVSDSLLRRRRLARQKSTADSRPKTIRK